MKKILLGLLVCAGMCACTNDDVVVSNSATKVLDGDVAYLTVKINDVGGGTRATEGTYQTGSEAEYAVSDAYFYFYDEEGLFVSRAEVWDGGTATTEGNYNVEFEGNTVIVLKGLTDVGFPRYMVTILNEPSNFETGLYEPAATLDEFQTKLAHAEQVGIYDAAGNFVMSTSAYVADGDAGGTQGVTPRAPWYFVTALEDTDFRPEPIPDNTEEIVPVEVYVERLAAKVEVGVAQALSGTATEITDEDGGTHYAYLLKETIAGDPNVEDDQGSTTADGEGVQDIYVEFLGWALNATARYSNIVKDITPFATDGVPVANIDGWSDWNVASDYRSYWGASFNYGIDGNYPETNINPETGVANTDDDEANSATWLNDYLKYTSLLEDNLLSLDDGYDYCAENTNTVEVLGDKNSSAITSVLLKAQAWYVNDEGTAVPITLVRYRGELWTESAFKNYVVQEFDLDGDDFYGLYYSETAPGENGRVTDENAVFTAINGDFLTIVNEGNGYIGIDLDTDAADEYYWYWLDSTGSYVWIGTAGGTPSTGWSEALLTSMEDEVESFNTYYASSINEYAGGLMYYSIPIEHLNNNYNYPEDPETLLYEANYGVVRNHWYQLSITALTQLGKGIVDDEEVIVPDPTEPTYYYVGANINILSWKLVNQSVSL